MISTPFRPLGLLLALTPLIAAVPVAAQGLYQPNGLSDADALGQAMRRLGSSPFDLEALLRAGELSVRVEDLSAAASFFARAEKIDPRSGRAAAGKGAIMVRSQRPAESLRFFRQAEQLGLPAAWLASDRGMAYDLLGDPGRAQRDYRLALAERPDAETQRRYALSLGSVGRQAQAVEVLTPLLRDNDRAAWRTRAFVLAMAGDAAEASRIAQTMMPPGAAAGLRSFFAELPQLSPIDRAFAVHFGEVRPSAIRLADARLAPRETPLPLEPLPVRVAAAVAQPPSAKQRKRDRKRRGEVQMAALSRDRPFVPVPQYLPQPPAYQAPSFQTPAYQGPAYQPLPRQRAPRAPMVASAVARDRPLSAGEQASLARAGLRTMPRAMRATPVPRSVEPPAMARALTPAEQANLAAATLRPAPARVLPLRREVPVAVATVVPAPVRREPGAVPLPTVQVPRPSAVASSVPAPTFSDTLKPATPLVIAVPPVTLASATPGRVPLATTEPGRMLTPLVTSAPLVTPAPLVAPVTAAATPPAVVTIVSPEPSPAAISLAASNSTPGPALSTAIPLPGFSSMPTAPEPAAATTPAPPVGSAAQSGTAPSAHLQAATSSVSVPTPGPAVRAAPVPGATLALAPSTTAEPSVAVAPIFTPLAPLMPPPTAPAATAVPPPVPVRLARDDAILAKIVADLTIPASELEVPGPTSPAGASAARRLVADKAVADRDALADSKAAANKKALADKRIVADKKALTDKKAAADKKAVADREAAAAAKLARGDPARIWVQVAGGANEAGLRQAWRAAQAKASVLAGRDGWTTPLRSTNRVLTGPFKTDVEARAHVNQLAKAGVSAFTFTSDAGQKITRLSTK